MLRIECESCHAPYQVDERRVPPQGLKMRCPKCGHTFSVSSGGATAVAVPSAAPAPPAKANLKMTMVGLGAGAADDAGLPAAAKPALPKSPPLPVKPAVPAPKPAAPHPPPMADMDDLPAARADLPAARPAPPRPNFGAPRPAAPPAPKPAAPPVPKPAVPKPAPIAAPVVASPLPEIDLPAPREKHPSLPAALGDFDLPAIANAKPAPAKPAPPPPPAGGAFGEIDLPALTADLPAKAQPAAPVVKPAPVAPKPAPVAPKPAPVAKPAAPAAPQEMTFDLDLPQAATSAPAPKRDDLELDLGPPADDLPAPLANLPAVAAQLPAKKEEPAFGEIDFPSLDAQLPTPQQAALPQVAATLPELADVLPTVGQQLPATVDDARLMPAHTETLDFGEVDLGPLGPAEIPIAPPLRPAPVISTAPNVGASPFAELDLDGVDVHSLPPSKPPFAPMAEEAAITMAAAPGHVPPPIQKQTNALKFGEVDLGAQAEADGVGSGASIQTEEPLGPPAHAGGGDELALPQAPDPGTNAGPAAELSLPIQTGRKRPEQVEEDRPSRAPRVALLLVVLLVLGGGALQLTKHGAFGYLTIGDTLHAKDYVAFTASQSAAARARMNKDTFPEARGAVDDLLAAHWRMPRAAGLTAYAAFAEFAYETRFGADAERNAKAKLILSDIVATPDAKYINAALAAEDAASGQIDKARKSLDAASKRDAGDPIQRDIALVRGEVELQGHDAKAAKTAFDTALKLGATAPAHYGLARVANASRDWATVASECDATIAATPHHPGALLLRAMQRYTEKSDDTNALADLAEITDGPAKPLASNQEIAQAHANRGQIFLSSGRAGDARNAFEAALKLDNRNVDALVGQGTVLYQESRYTEALTRFDTALGARPDDETAIAYDAMTKVKLERLKDAKDQLVAARTTKFPKSTRITYALAMAEIALGNSADAEKDLRQAIDFANPKDPESVQPYIALATSLAAHNRDKDAQAVIDEAKQKLPDEAPVAVAFGEYDAAQGKYEDAVAHFRHALELSPTSLSTHFKLGVTYRHMRKTDLAAQEFDSVLSIDKDYPGLARDPGLLLV